jgi:polyisoprenoid-binding protein YceI
MLLTSALALCVGLPALAADTFNVDTAHSEVTFQVSHLTISKVRGRFKEFEGNIQVEPGKPEVSSVEFKIKVASVDTADPKRDEHLRSADFFDAANHPEIVFKSSKIVAKGNDTYDVTGNLTIRGNTKTITLPVKVAGPIQDPWGNTKIGFETATTINRKDFGVSWSKAMDNGGLVVSDDVAITIALETAKKKDK